MRLRMETRTHASYQPVSAEISRGSNTNGLTNSGRSLLNYGIYLTLGMSEVEKRAKRRWKAHASRAARRTGVALWLGLYNPSDMTLDGVAPNCVGRENTSTRSTKRLGHFLNRTRILSLSSEQRKISMSLGPIIYRKFPATSGL
jgi:hypothetical protein